MPGRLPPSADPMLQVRAPEELITQKVDIIGVLPNDPKVLEPALPCARAAAVLHGKGVRQPIVTLEMQGALLSEAGVSQHIAAFAAQPVDTTAAGDGVNGVWAARLAAGESLAAAHFATACAAVCGERRSVAYPHAAVCRCATAPAAACAMADPREPRQPVG